MATRLKMALADRQRNPSSVTLLSTPADEVIRALSDDIKEELERGIARVLEARLDVNIPDVDTAPIQMLIEQIGQQIINAVSGIQPVVNIPQSESVDLGPVLDAIASIRIPETKPVKINNRPRKWVLQHHYDSRGRIIETEAVAEEI